MHKNILSFLNMLTVKIKIKSYHNFIRVEYN